MDSESGLTFDRAAHRYAFNGQPVPNVTSVLDTLGFSDLGRVPPDVMEAARARGEDVHYACELLDTGQLDYTTVTEEIAGYVMAYEKFKHEYKPVILAIEERVYHPVYKFAGTLDRVWRIKGSVDLADLKAGVDQPCHQMQTAAYRLAWDSGHPPGMAIKKRHALYLRANGTFDYRVHNGVSDGAAFLAAIQLFYWRNSNP